LLKLCELIIFFLNLAGTVEGMIYYLQKFENICCLFDEAGQFIGAIGRYNGGGSSAVMYERSIYLELGNAPRDFRRDLKINRCLIKYPRCNLCMNGNIFINPSKTLQSW